MTFANRKGWVIAINVPRFGCLHFGNMSVVKNYFYCFENVREHLRVFSNDRPLGNETVFRSGNSGSQVGRALSMCVFQNVRHQMTGLDSFLSNLL